jgi:hypothetical protein
VAFHDRILDIDEVDLYHLGGSIKDVGARRTSMFSRIEEPAVLATVRTEFQKAWQSATIVI